MLTELQNARATIEQLTAEVTELRRENEQLQAQVSQSTSDQPELHRSLGNLEIQRDRVLAEWKVAKRAESKERVKEALDRLIRYFVETVHPKGEQKPKLTTTQLQPTWESRADDFLREVAGNV